MKLSVVKKALSGLSAVNFTLTEGTYVPRHCHWTEVGLVTKHFIDCGVRERKETVVNCQLWEAGDNDHRIAPEKFLSVPDIAGEVMGDAESLDMEVEYQQSTIGRFGFNFDGTDCMKCVTTEDRIKNTADSIGVRMDLRHVHDPGMIATRGVMSTPDVMDAGKLVHKVGQPSNEEIEAWIK